MEKCGVLRWHVTLSQHTLRWHVTLSQHVLSSCITYNSTPERIVIVAFTPAVQRHYFGNFMQATCQQATDLSSHNFIQTWSQGHNMQGQGQGLDLRGQGQGPDLRGQGQGLDLQGQGQGQGLDLQGQGLNSRGQGGLSKQILVCHYVKI